LINPAKSHLFSPEVVAQNRDQWVKDWVEGLSQ